MTPLYFGRPDTPLFGWFHAADAAPSPGTPPLAVLLCAPLGHEDLATHRGLRRLASTLAAAGLPTLRFDHAGCGDSADPDVLSAAEADPAARWLQSIQVAADTLLARSGATKLALVGVRIGALLAAHAALSRDDVAALVALLPVASGRAWLRECRLLADQERRAAGSASAPPADVNIDTDIGGLVLDAAAAAGVSALGWPAAGAPRPAAQSLVIERNDMAPGPAVQALRSLGSDVTGEALADLDRVTAVAHSAHLPQAVIDRIAGWLAMRAAALADVALRSSRSVCVSTAASAQVAVGAARVDECAVCIGTLPRLAGVLTSPSGAAPTAAGTPRRGLLLLSSGAERRIGPNRLWVAFARRRAAAGDVVLRLDLAGIGDSDDRPQPALHVEGASTVYDPRCVDDIGSALEWMRHQHGVQRCDVIGVCSGAHHAWRAALQGVELSTVVAINPLLFHWRPGMSLDPAAHAFGQLAISADAARAVRDPARWLKLLRGQVHVRVIVAALLARCRAAPWRVARSGLRVLGVPLRDDLASELRSVARRGVDLHFVFAHGEPGLCLLRQEAAASLTRLQQQGRVCLSQVDAADHSFTQQHAREALYDTLHRALDAAALQAQEPVRRTSVSAQATAQGQVS